MMSFLSYFCIQDDLHAQDGLIQRVTRPKLSWAKTPCCQEIEIEKTIWKQGWKSSVRKK